MSRNRFRRIDGDGPVTERSKEIREYPGGNYRGKHLNFTQVNFHQKEGLHENCCY